MERNRRGRLYVRGCRIFNISIDIDLFLVFSLFFLVFHLFSITGTQISLIQLFLHYFTFFAGFKGKNKKWRKLCISVLLFSLVKQAKYVVYSTFNERVDAPSIYLYIYLSISKNRCICVSLSCKSPLRFSSVLFKDIFHFD